jgi:hypothetical protein
MIGITNARVTFCHHGDCAGIISITGLPSIARLANALLQTASSVKRRGLRCIRHHLTTRRRPLFSSGCGSSPRCDDGFRRTAGENRGEISVDDSRGHEEGKRNVYTGAVAELRTSVQFRQGVIPLFRLKGTSTGDLAAYLADETSINTTSTANTKLATSKKITC